jgi:hypothetical protein
MIRGYPKVEFEFKEYLADTLTNVDGKLAREIWLSVYECCEELPPGVADALR